MERQDNGKVSPPKRNSIKIEVAGMDKRALNVTLIQMEHFHKWKTEKL